MVESPSRSSLAQEPVERLDVCRALFEASPLAILVADDDGRYLEANPAACRLFGTPYDQLVGRSISEFIDPESLAQLAPMWKAFRDQKSQAGDFPLIRPDGSRRMLRYQAVADFVPGLHVSFLEDITEAHALRATLEASEAHFRTLADTLPIMIWTEDAEGHVQYSNRHWFEYTGRPPLPAGAPEHDAWQDAVHPEDLEQLALLLPDARADGGVINVMLRIRRRDGVYRWHVGTAVPIYDARGQLLQRLGSATDIEDQRRAIETLQHERELRERFVASLSHDLRSPLTAAKMGAQLLESSRARPERLLKQIDRVVRNIDRADQLIQNMLDVTRISAGEPLPLDRNECDLAATAREVIEDQTTIHGDRFALDAPAALHAACDPSAFRRTLENLIGNAIKYGDPQGKVDVNLAESGDQVTLAVHNLGDPIPADEQALIFEPYQRARSGQHSSGWGLGLTLVRGIARAHGGDVRVDSSAESGTTFTVTLDKRARPAAELRNP